MASFASSEQAAPYVAQAQRSAAALGIAEGDVRAALESADYFALLERMVALRPTAPPQPIEELRRSVERLLRFKTYAFPQPWRHGKPAPVVFGTGGHRGEIGLGLTLAHVQVIMLALVARMEAMSDEERMDHFGARSLTEVKARGFVIGHDNRLFNPEFSFFASHLLRERGYRTRYAGRVASPEISRIVPLNGWAGALNFTPSHNPFRYGGIKFSPADGGLAGGDLSDPLAAAANGLLERLSPEAWPSHSVFERLIAAEGDRVERVDLHTPYLEALKRHPVIRLEELGRELRALPEGQGARLVADPVFGGAVPVYQQLRPMLGKDWVELLNTEDDAYFGGQTTEPNPQTLEAARGRLDARPARYLVAVRNDPDGDRGLVGDGETAIRMNQFAALVMRYLMDIGCEGGVATTYATSRFAQDFARARGREVFLTPVGFKNFRDLLGAGQAMMGYEESDGITIAGHTLDKDGVLTGLLALRMVLHYQKSLSELLAEIEAEAGRYHYKQLNFEVDISAAEVKQKLTALATVQPGDTLGEGEQGRRVKAINTEDGYLFVFEDGTWLMMRPSGTEPKVRIYAETCSSMAATDALCEFGQELALRTIA